MKKLLYIHGYNGSANGHSCQLFRKHAPAGWQVIGMEYDQDDCQVALQQIRQTVDDEKIDLVVGSSLGGFLTLLTTGVRRIVINPCYLPSVELPALGSIKELPTPKPEMIDTYAAYEDVLKTFDENERKLITGYFAPADELLADRYHETFRRDVHDFVTIHGGHHVVEEAVVQICNDIK